MTEQEGKYPYIREGFKKKKKKGKIPLSEGGGAAPDFPLRKKKQKNMGFKHWILPNNQFKTHLFFFSILG